MIYRLFFALTVLFFSQSGIAGTITLTAEVNCPNVQTLYLFRFGGLQDRKSVV